MCQTYQIFSFSSIVAMCSFLATPHNDLSIHIFNHMYIRFFLFHSGCTCCLKKGHSNWSSSQRSHNNAIACLHFADQVLILYTISDLKHNNLFYICIYIRNLSTLVQNRFTFDLFSFFTISQQYLCSTGNESFLSKTPR